MEGRELTFANPKIANLVADNFIPLAGDDWYQRRRRDDEGKFFRLVADQGPRKGAGGRTRQGFYAFTAWGHLLGYRSHHPDPQVMHEFFRTAYLEWRKLPLEQRRPGAYQVKDMGKPDSKFDRSPPRGGLVVTVYTRILDRDGRGKLCPGSCGFLGGDRCARDRLWITAAEIKALLPADPKSGAVVPVPPTLALRIARFHLVDNTRGEPTFWKRNEVRGGSLKAIVERIDGQGIKLRLEGFYFLSTDADPQRAGRGFDVHLRGHIHYNRRANTIDGFDLVALGDHWGEGRFTPGSRPGRKPLGLVFELARGDAPADRVPPQASRDLGDYLTP